MKVEKDKWKIEVSDGYCSWEYTWRKGEPINVSIIDIVEEAQNLLGLVDEAECTSNSISLPRRGRKVLLVYEEYLSARTRNKIRDEYENNNLVILEGNPEVIIIEDTK